MTDPVGVGPVFGRLIIWNAVIWAATMLTAAIVAKASDAFFSLLLVLLVGSSLSGWAIEAARRRLDPGQDSTTSRRHPTGTTS